MHTMQLVQLLIEFTDNLHLLMSHSSMCQFPCSLLRHKQCCFLYYFVLLFSSLSLFYWPPIFVLPRDLLHILHCNFFLCSHCNIFPGDCCVQLLVLYNDWCKSRLRNVGLPLNKRNKYVCVVREYNVARKVIIVFGFSTEWPTATLVLVY
jgi:hypothetical protein